MSRAETGGNILRVQIGSRQTGIQTEPNGINRSDSFFKFWFSFQVERVESNKFGSFFVLGGRFA